MCRVPLISVVAGRNSLTTLPIASPLRSCTNRETANAANTTVRCASIASLVRWKIGRARRSSWTSEATAWLWQSEVAPVGRLELDPADPYPVRGVTARSGPTATRPGWLFSSV